MIWTVGSIVLAHAGHTVNPAGTVSLSLGESYVGGFLSFFSIWFFCLLQISPFFFAFLLGLASMDLPAMGAFDNGMGIKKVLLAGLLSLSGFSVIFTLLGVSASPAAILIYRYLPLFNQIGGILALLVGSVYIGVLKLPENGKYVGVIYVISSILFGMALAFAYKPCVTPTLSKIYTYTKNPRTVMEGAFFLISYSAGVATSLLSVGLIISTAAAAVKKPGLKNVIRLLSGVLLIVMGIMILTDWMVAYKSLLVGGLVK